MLIGVAGAADRATLTLIGNPTEIVVKSYIVTVGRELMSGLITVTTIGIICRNIYDGNFISLNSFEEKYLWSISNFMT